MSAAIDRGPIFSYAATWPRSKQVAAAFAFGDRALMNIARAPAIPRRPIAGPNPEWSLSVHSNFLGDLLLATSPKQFLGCDLANSRTLLRPQRQANHNPRTDFVPFGYGYKITKPSSTLSEETGSLSLQNIDAKRLDPSVHQMGSGSCEDC